MRIPFAPCFTTLVCFSQFVYAGIGTKNQDVTKKLSSHSQAIIKHLNELNHLPAGKWRYHLATMAHGESVNLNDANWKQIESHSHAPKEAAWYRQWIEVPKNLHGYDLTNARVWFQFSASAQSPLTQIIYFNGRRIALGEDLEPIVLFEQVKSGDNVLVAVKLMPTTAEKTINNIEMKIDFPHNRIDPEKIREELLSTLILAPTFTKNEEDTRATIEHAIQTIDLTSLTAGDQIKFDSSLLKAHTMLNVFAPTLTQTNYYLIGNSHIDAAWKWPWTETVDVVKRTFATTLQLMHEYPDYKFTQSSAQYNEWMAEKYPAMHDEIKNRIKEGRWEIVGGMWVEPDLNLPDGEAIARSLLIGKRWFKQNYAVDVRVGWNPDSFGYNWQMPQIYKKSGVDYFVTQKMQWNDTNPLPFKLFWWQSPDGSKVLTYFPHELGNDNLNPVRLATDFAVARQEAPGSNTMIDLYGIGDHGGGPTRAILDEGTEWMQANKLVPKMRFSSAQAFFSMIEKDIAITSPEWNYQRIAKGYHAPNAIAKNQISIPTWDSELYLEYHRGVFTTEANQKRHMRESVVEALTAEKLASIAWLNGDAYPNDKLTEAWKKITFNDFHDLAAGSGINVLYKDAERDYDNVRMVTNEISQAALKTLTAPINTNPPAKEMVPIFIFNPLAWERSDYVDIDVQMPKQADAVSLIDANGNTIPSLLVSSDPKTNRYRLLAKLNNIPSLGYKIIYTTPDKRTFTSDLSAKDTTLENTNLRVVIDKKTGCMLSLYDKKAAVETIAANACANQLQLFKDTPKKYDAWNIDPGALDHPLNMMKLADSVELIEQNLLRSVIRIKRSDQHSTFVQDIELYAGSDEVVITNDIDWHEKHVLLKVAFPVAAFSPFATYEIPYGTIDRPTTRNNRWEKAQFEVPALRFADLGNGQHGLTLINESKYGYDARDNVLRLTLLRSPTYPDPTADQGHHHFRYALYPHSGTWKEARSLRRGYEFNYPLIVNQVNTHDGAMPAEHSFIHVAPENIVLSAMKKAEDSHALIFHLYETDGKAANMQLTIPAGAISASITNLLEQPMGPALTIQNNKVTAPIHPYEILALKVDY